MGRLAEEGGLFASGGLGVGFRVGEELAAQLRPEKVSRSLREKS